MGVICDLIRTLNDALGATSIIVTHDVTETFAFADYIYFIADGIVAAEGSPSDLKNLNYLLLSNSFTLKKMARFHFIIKQMNI